MTIKEIKLNYNLYNRDGGFHLHSKEVGGRTVHKYLCTITKHSGTKFSVIGYEPVSKFELLQEQIDKHLSSLEYDSEYYCPSYRKGTAQDWHLNDLLTGYGFKRGGWKEPDGFNLKPEGIYGGSHSEFNVNYTINIDTEEVNIYLSTGKFSWVEVSCGFDLKTIHKTLDGLLKPILLTEGIKNIQISKKMEMSNIDLTILKLKDLDVDTSKIELKNELLKIANSL